MTANEAARIALEAAQWLRRNKIDVQTWTEKYEQAKAVLDKHLALDADPLATPAAVFVHPDDMPEPPTLDLTDVVRSDEQAASNGAWQ